MHDRLHPVQWGQFRLPSLVGYVLCSSWLAYRRNQHQTLLHQPTTLDAKSASVSARSVLLVLGLLTGTLANNRSNENVVVDGKMASLPVFIAMNYGA